MEYIIEYKRELTLLVHLFVLTGVPVWVSHKVVATVSMFPIYISFAIHCILTMITFFIVLFTIS